MDTKTSLCVIAKSKNGAVSPIIVKGALENIGDYMNNHQMIQAILIGINNGVFLSDLSVLKANDDGFYDTGMVLFLSKRGEVTAELNVVNLFGSTGGFVRNASKGEALAMAQDILNQLQGVRVITELVRVLDTAAKGTAIEQKSDASSEEENKP